MNCLRVSVSPLSGGMKNKDHIHYGKEIIDSKS